MFMLYKYLYIKKKRKKSSEAKYVFSFCYRIGYDLIKGPSYKKQFAQSEKKKN